jgi:hypothetical protein
MPVKMNMTRDVSGFNAFGLVPTDFMYTGVLGTGDAAQSITVSSAFPYENYLAVFSYTPGANVFVSVNDTAAIPSGNLALDTSELNPSARQVKAGDSISLINADAADVYATVLLYVVNEFSGS